MAEHRTTALFIALPGLELPPEVEVVEPFVAGGFEAGESEIEALGSGMPQEDAVYVLWVGGEWSRGIDFLDRLPEVWRHRTVLVGEPKPGQNLIRKMIQLGTLAAVAHPELGWFVEPLRKAVLRDRGNFQRRFFAAVQELQGKVGHSPENLLVDAAEVAGDLLGAELRLATLKGREGNVFGVLVREPNGRIREEKWPDDPERLRAPRGLAAFAFKHREITLVSSARHSSLCKPGQGEETYDAAVIRPLQIRQTGIGGQPRPIFAALNLYWRQPHLPTPEEILALEALATFANASLVRLREQARLANIHATARQVLTEPMYGEPANRSATFEASDEILKSLGRDDPDPLESFILLMLGTYSGRLDLEEFWVRLPHQPSGSPEPQWISLGGSEAQGGPPERARESRGEVDVVTVSGGETDRWAAQVLLQGDSPHLGELVAIFRSQAAAWAAVAEIQRLANDLFRAICLHRRAADTTALHQLSTVPAGPEEAQENLRKILETVRRQTASDGAKVFVMVRTSEGPKISQLASTEFPEAAPQTLRFRAERGLADWVLAKDDWLLIPETQPADLAGKEPELAVTGQHDVLLVLSRSEKEYWPSHEHPDLERSMILVPLHTGPRVTGVVAVWRVEPIPYDEHVDLRSVQYLAPHVAAACQRMLQMDKSRLELESLQKMNQALNKAESLEQSYLAVAEGMGRLAASAGVLLLRWDGERRTLFLCATWTAGGVKYPDLQQKLRRFKVACDVDPKAWEEGVKAALGELGLPLVYRALLIPHLGQEPSHAAALLDPRRAENEPVFFSDRLLDHYALSFLHSASSLLDGQAANLTNRLADQISTNVEDSDQILEKSAFVLRTITGADAALTYLGTPEYMELKSSWPASADLEGLTVTKGSFTQRALLENGTIRIPEVAEELGLIDRKNLDKITDALGWPGIGSWLCCSVKHGDLTMGLIKLLTRSDGAFLGPDHERVVELFTVHTAVEMHKARRRVMLQKLLKLSNELTESIGKDLGGEMCRRLHLWVAEMLHRRRCEVAVVASMVGGTRLVVSATQGIKPKQLERLEYLSHYWKKELQAGRLQSLPGQVAGAFALQHPRGIALPIDLPGEERLEGHLYLLDQEPFVREEIEAALDAAHYMAVVLNSKRERVGWRESMGRFRHAVLGPVQGVMEASKELRYLADHESVKNDDLVDVRRLLEEEIETLRLWRENGRFYLAEETELKIEHQPFRPVIEKIVKRFRSTTAERNIQLHLKWNITGERQFMFMFDKEAIDLAISNLLDNAQKYAFFNREVTLGVDLVRFESVNVWVEDIGHEIPEKVRQEIYTLGKRGSRPDPFRLIHGQGLGLHMVLNIVKAHGGELKHSCERESSREETTETTPFRVRFTMELPYRRLTGLI